MGRQVCRARSSHSLAIHEEAPHKYIIIRFMVSLPRSVGLKLNNASSPIAYVFPLLAFGRPLQECGHCQAMWNGSLRLLRPPHPPEDNPVPLVSTPCVGK
eukprot:1385600-Pyramimonas_sp.AAC.1